ncbi:hypothetical protein DQG23_06115 [Paenibacillus contaminans]|uniref:Uncharacterized protein n=1 Tax=Paenibacillus contaminans TaxID=450362 RepID=A0A329MT80_9BACL|nr:hypothetical protein DQG23_06115 [Paenibacillus contaminans]
MIKDNKSIPASYNGMRMLFAFLSDLPPSFFVSYLFYIVYITSHYMQSCSILKARYLIKGFAMAGKCMHMA